MAKYILVIGILISFSIRLFFILNGKHVADIWHIGRMGEVLLQGQNPFLVLDFNVYPPGAILLSALSLKLYETFILPFNMLIKIWPNLADFISAFVIYKFLVKTKVKPIKATFWSLAFLLNPISIIISSAHGQLDSVATLFVLLSIYLLTFYSTIKTYFLSAFCLGLAITVKPNPVILIPLFLFFKKVKLSQRFNFLSIVVLVVGISLIPFLLQDPLQVLSKLLSYSGVYDFSYPAIFRGIWYQINASPQLPQDLMNQMFSVSKITFLIGAFGLFVLYAGGKQLAKSCLAIYLLFFSCYFGIGAQYLTWVIALAVLEREKMLIYYTIFGTVALIGFYLFFGPDLLLGKFASFLPFERKYMYFYFYGNMTFWLISLGWLIKIIIQYLKGPFLTFGLVRKRIIIASFLLFTISLLPMANLILQFFKLYTLDN